jgi:hypothetical protein
MLLPVPIPPNRAPGSSASPSGLVWPRNSKSSGLAECSWELSWSYSMWLYSL